MSGKWDHINEFIKQKNNRPQTAKRKEVFKDKPISLKAQVVKPVKSFDYKIESFFGYFYYSIVSPQVIAKDEDSSKYFLFSLLNVLLYTLVLLLQGIEGLSFNMMSAIRHVTAGLTLSFIIILLTFFIQLFSLNNKNTIYKIFVDTMSYYTAVMLTGLIAVLLRLLSADYLPYIELLSMIVMLLIPMRLFMIYHEKHQFDVDTFTLNMLLTVLVISYMILVRNNIWLSIIHLFPQK